MKYEIKYNGNKRKALNDAVRWFECKRYKLLVKLIKQGHSFESIRFYSAFGGCTGYPVRCMIERYHPRVVMRFGKQK